MLEFKITHESVLEMVYVVLYGVENETNTLEKRICAERLLSESGFSANRKIPHKLCAYYTRYDEKRHAIPSVVRTTWFLTHLSTSRGRREHVTIVRRLVRVPFISSAA